MKYMPSNPDHQPMKFESRMKPGLYLGPHFDHHGKPSGDALVLNADDYIESPDGSPNIERTRDFHIPKEIRFPVKDGNLTPISSSRVSKESREAKEVLDEGLHESEQNQPHPLENPVIKQQVEPDTTADHWKVEGNFLVRVHVTPRSELFVPEDSPDVPVGWDINFLNPLRFTTYKLEDGTVTRIHDAYGVDRQHDKRSLPYEWTGDTKFLKFNRS